MKSFYLMKNQIRDYAWGHHRHIPEMLGITWPEGKPAAEVWMGAHPSAPSLIDIDGQWTGLDEWISNNPVSILGHETSQMYGKLPYMLKLLAAGKSLSIQAHPDRKKAEEGFARENDLGISLDSPFRQYKDNNHKPEIIMALTPFTAMIGFRSPYEIFDNFHSLGELEKLDCLKKDGEKGLKDFTYELLTLPEIQRRYLLEKTLESARNPHASGWDDIQCKWLLQLSHQFPMDAGILAPLFLNLVQIKPGQALYQPARVLHAYLSGFGVELMASSDNVLRGGLTPKNIDVNELLQVLDFQPTEPAILEIPVGKNANSVEFFPTEAKEFSLGIGRPGGKNDSELRIPGGEGPLIILCLKGSVSLEDEKDALSLSAGKSAFVPFSASDIRISGTGEVVLAEPGR